MSLLVHWRQKARDSEGNSGVDYGSDIGHDDLLMFDIRENRGHRPSRNGINAVEKMTDTTGPQEGFRWRELCAEYAG
jgi:hypothetical protein